MTGKTAERQHKGKGGVPELAAELAVELKDRTARLYSLWLDHAASMCEEEMIAKELESGRRRELLRRIPKQLGNMIAEAACIVPFTGAGISTECGIPDFQ